MKAGLGCWLLGATAVLGACAGKPALVQRACTEISGAAARRVLGTRCTTCHSPRGSAGEEHDFADPSTVHVQAQLIAARVRARSMPPRGFPQPSDEQRELLARWAECGAP